MRQLASTVMLVIVMITSSVMLPMRVLAATDKVEVEFLGQVSYRLSDDLLQADGGVEIKHGQVMIKGERLLVDLANNLLKIEGSASLVLQDGEVAGEALYYDMNTGKWSFYAAKAALAVPKFNDPVYLSGELFESDEKHLVITKGTATTCSLGKPHYHLQADKLEIYPNDKLVVRNVVYKEGNIPLFYWPYLSLPIKEEGSLNLPEIGYTAMGGWFVGGKWDYRLHDNLSGKLTGQYHQRSGIVLGATGDYTLSKAQNGQLFIEYRQNRLIGGGQWRGGFAHYLIVGPLKLSGGMERQVNLTSNGIGKDALQAGLQLQGRTEETSGSVGIVYNLTETPTKITEQLTGDVKLSTQLDGNWSSNIQGKYTTKQDGQLPVTRVEYLAKLSKIQPDLRFDLAFEQKLNPNLGSNQAVAWHSVSKLPELSLSTSSPKYIGTWPYDFTLKLGRYREEPKGTEAVRSTLELNLKNKSYQLTDGIKLSLGSTQSLSIYGQDAYYARFNPRIILNWQLLSKLSMNSTLQVQQVLGESPFAFEQATSSQVLTNQLAYRSDRTDWSLSGGYNIHTGRFQDVNVSFQVRSDQTDERGWQLGLSGAFNPYTNAMVSTTGLFEKRFGEQSIKLGASYNLLKRRLDRFDAQINIKLSDTWTLVYAGIYKGIEDKWQRGDLALTKDLHCRELVFRYNQLQNMFWVEYRIYALPEGRFKLGTTGDQFMFNAEGWQNLIQ
ncbi:MAG: hypothetical protein PHH90_03095 [Limnochordia bacterium]|nr:hypothetical protein [Limnochordia bacterium]